MRPSVHRIFLLFLFSTGLQAQNPFAFKFEIVPFFDLREEFNKLYQLGKYDEAEKLLVEKGPSSPYPEEAAKILQSLRTFRTVDPEREAGFKMLNPNNHDLTYQYRWSDGLWEDITLKPFQEIKHTHIANRQDNSGVTAQVRLKDPAPADSNVLYNIKPRVTVKSPNADIVTHYFATREMKASYTISGVPEGNNLLIREGAGTKYPVAFRLKNGSSDVHIMGHRQMGGNEQWAPIWANGFYGWVPTKYLKLTTPAPYEFFDKAYFPPQYAKVVIENKTNLTMPLQYRWSTEEKWTTLKIPSGESRYWFWTYQAAPTIFKSPDFNVRFYSDTAGTKKLTHRLERDIVTDLSKDGRRYYFRRQEDGTILLNSN